MARPPLAPRQYAVLATVALVAVAGCKKADEGTARPVASSTAQPAGGSATSNDYPDWAAAVVPAYTSNVQSKGRTTVQPYDTYEIITADSYETVLAWYQAHVQTKWPTRNPNMTSGHVGNIAITLQKSGSDGKTTTIGLIKKL